MTVQTRPKAEEQVAAGVSYLDERLPGWRKLVDPNALDLKSSCGCVLGQVFGDYDKGLAVLNLNDEEACTLGFFTTMPGRSWERLTRLWKRAAV